MSDSYRFPDDFLWGAATSAYQIEGSPTADGAGRSIWHRFSHTPGNTWLDQTGDMACDHYNRYRADVALMSELGLNAYRFSISWSRIYPNGTGLVNRKGVDFYSRLVDALLEKGIKPNATLYHWDLPEALDDRGGWLNRDISEWFCDYAVTMFDALGDRVEMWSTLNEPWVVTDGGYLAGVLAPGHSNLFEAPVATHNLLRAHGTAVERFRATSAAKKGKIGIVVNLEPKYPASQSPEDLDAVRRADAYMNRQYLDPVFKGEYPAELREIFGEAWPQWSDEDMRLIKQPIDFLGVNYYTRRVERYHPDYLPLRTRHVPQPQHIETATNWEVFPEALTRVLLWINERYGRLPIYITENGAAFYDPPHTIDGRVEDPLRIEYYRQHLRAAHAAMKQGVNLRGYYAWSLLDNYEWAHGYSKRFGIVHVDYSTQQRTIKSSGRYYSSVIRSKGEILSK
ncbi:MAG TPA: GH1 family beta-glucosidase [Gemmatimonadaceae bacterium]|nr:GH1 family beta-glucosidase [Gemmatimonadaceae bacterium]